MPPYEGFDEVWHVQYVMDVARTGGFPTLPSPNFEGHQPPGFYYAAAVLARVAVHRVPSWPGPPLKGDPPLVELHHSRADLCLWCAQRPIHVLRTAATGFGVVALILAYLMVLTGFPTRPWLAVAAAATVGFVPQFAYLSGVVNNDTAATAAGGLATLGAVGVATAEERPRLLAFGAVFGTGLGLGLLMKESALATIPLLALATFVNPRARRQAVAISGIGAAVALLFAGWYLARNSLIYGQPLPFAAERANVGRLMAGVVVPRNLTDHYFLVSFPREMFQTFWYGGGWGQIRYGVPLYAALGVVSAIAVAACALALARHPRPAALDPRERRALLVLAAALPVAVAASVYYNLTYQQPQGRHMFWALPAIAAMLVIGLRTTFGSRFGTWLAVALPTGLFLLCVYTLFGLTFPGFWA